MGKLRYDDLYQNEAILALVQPVGTDLRAVRQRIRQACENLQINCVFINLTNLIKPYVSEIRSSLTNNNNKKNLVYKTFQDEVAALCNSDKFRSESYLDLSIKMHAGSCLRSALGNGIFAAYGSLQIHYQRQNLKNGRPTIYVLDSLKHIDEVNFLRVSYGDAFYLIAVHTSLEQRVRDLIHRKSMSEEEIYELIKRDEKESLGHGQQSEKTFEQADFFINLATPPTEYQRFIEIIFGNPNYSPYRTEHLMHLAASSACLSADLGRQVGAVIIDEYDEVISLGRNEVPRIGGLFAEGDPNDSRDKAKGIDPNRQRTKEIIDLAEKSTGQTLGADVKAKIGNLIEFHRTVHAEVDAIISCSRRGISLRGARMLTTTFPCHNCAKHILAAGIKEVTYIENYSKSLALDLHGEFLSSDDTASPPIGVNLRRFQGIGPRRYIDLFSQTFSTGKIQPRKDDHSGQVKIFSLSDCQAKFPALTGQVQQAELNSEIAFLGWKWLHACSNTDQLRDWALQLQAA